MKLLDYFPGKGLSDSDGRWKAIQSQDLPALNSQLRQANLPELKLEANPEPQESGGNRE